MPPTQDSATVQTLLHRLKAFLADLKRRRVYRVAAVYAGVAFVLLEAASLVVDALGLPSVVMTVLTAMALFGFPLALVLAWAFDVTPDGVRRTAPATTGEAEGTLPTDSAHPVNTDGRGLGWLVVLAGGVLAAGAAGWWLLGTGTGPEAVDASEIRSLAVLPLDNLSGDPEEEPFVGGMHDELINQLSRVGALAVTSRTSVMRYRADSLRSMPEIGRELNVDAVVEGSVLRAEDRVRITVQLIHAATDTHVWSESFDRPVRDVLALHSEVARAVAREVEAVLTADEERRLATSREVDPEALEHYVRGRHLWNQRTPGALADAMTELRAAVDIDPGYAEAWAAIADAYVVPAGRGLVDDPVPLAVDAARRALALDSTLAEAHTALAYGLMIDEWAWTDAERHFRRAIDLNPSYATAHQWYAELLAAQNRMDEAVASARRATGHDPLSGIIAWNLGRILYFARRYTEAIEAARRGEELGRADPMIIPAAYAQLGQVDAAWAHFESTVLDQSPPELRAEARSTLERVEASYLGDGFYAARAHLATLSDQPTSAAAPGGTQAGALAQTGRPEESLDVLEEMVASGTLHFAVVDLAADPALDPLEDHPRYRALLERVGLAHRWPADAQSGADRE